MAYNNIDQAVTIPVNRDIQNFSMQLYQQSERRRQEETQNQKDDLARQDQLAKYVGDQFSDKHFLTGTAYDPVIDGMVADAHKRNSELIRKDSKVRLADVSYGIQQDVNKITEMSTKIKAVRASIAAQRRVFEKQPGVDADAWEKLALNSAFYYTDPKTGVKALKKAEEVDMSKDYFVDEIVLIYHKQDGI
ncbi:MAG: hypothetical protein WKF89_15390 [Chitinophagaceae bacterium]